MASSALQMHPFARTVTLYLRDRFPESLADKSFDNTGLLIESPWSQSHPFPLQNTALLAVDLTFAVAEEAIRKKAAIVVAYHPIIFRGLKQLSLQNSQQRSIMQLVQRGISVYCPHTAIDAHPRGNAAWVCEKLVSSMDPNQQNGVSGGYRVKAITPSPYSDGIWPTGMGRVVELGTGYPIRKLVRAMQDLVGGEALSIASPSEAGGLRNHLSENPSLVESFAVCLGSGGSVLKGCEANVLITGEMSHHETLAAVENGQMVIAMRHSKGEREYLAQSLAPIMQQEIQKYCVDELVAELGEVQVLMSEADRDPYDILTDEIMDA